MKSFFESLNVGVGLRRSRISWESFRLRGTDDQQLPAHCCCAPPQCSSRSAGCIRLVTNIHTSALKIKKQKKKLIILSARIREVNDVHTSVHNNKPNASFNKLCRQAVETVHCAK